MKPYCKTIRAFKDHKASECSLCRERKEGGKNYARQQGKQEIIEELIMNDEYNEEYVEETYTIKCDVCEREVVHASDTGEPVIGESCSDINCELLSSGREGGDPEELNFHEDRGC